MSSSSRYALNASSIGRLHSSYKSSGQMRFETWVFIGSFMRSEFKCWLLAFLPRLSHVEASREALWVRSREASPPGRILRRLHSDRAPMRVVVCFDYSFLRPPAIGRS